MTIVPRTVGSTSLFPLHSPAPVVAPRVRATFSALPERICAVRVREERASNQEGRVDIGAVATFFVPPVTVTVSLSLVTFCVAFCHGREATTKPRYSSSVGSNECTFFQLDRQRAETPRGGFSRTVDRSRSNTGSSLSWRS